MSTDVKDGTGFNMRFGTYEDAIKRIGTKTEAAFGEVEVNSAMIKIYCSYIEDGNPSYWDKEFAEKQWGGVITPPGIFQSWVASLQWHPDGEKKHELLLFSTPLPGDKVINSSTEMEFYRPVKVGEHINSVEELVAVSKEKTTRLGTGHFITTVTTYRNQTGEKVAKATNTLFRYSSEEV
jgi:acyl dehydratase